MSMDDISLSEAFGQFYLQEGLNVRVPHIFCDCDGVLADFHKTFGELYGLKGDSEVNNFLNAPDGWKRVEETHPDIFAKCAVLPDAHFLINSLVKLRDHGHIRLSILTALPNEWLTGPRLKYGVSASEDKKRWIARNFSGLSTKDVITCARKDKPAYGVADKLAHGIPPVLIDDYKKNTVEWIAQTRGYAIQHKDARSTLAQLGVHLKGLAIENG